MGFIYEFNWILKLSDLEEERLQVGEKYSFTKSGVRAFPLDMPIDLVNSNWEAVARCAIDQITITSKDTKGIYTIIELYDKEKREVLTKQWRELLKYSKGISEMADFSKVHIT